MSSSIDQSKLICIIHLVILLRQHLEIKLFLTQVKKGDRIHL